MVDDIIFSSMYSRESLKITMFDDCMYIAKVSGRNRECFSFPLTPSEAVSMARSIMERYDD